MSTENLRALVHYRLKKLMKLCLLRRSSSYKAACALSMQTIRSLVVLLPTHC